MTWLLVFNLGTSEAFIQKHQLQTPCFDETTIILAHSSVWQRSNPPQPPKSPLLSGATNWGHFKLDAILRCDSEFGAQSLWRMDGFRGRPGNEQKTMNPEAEVTCPECQCHGWWWHIMDLLWKKKHLIKHQKNTRTGKSMEWKHTWTYLIYLSEATLPKPWRAFLWCPRKWLKWLIKRWLSVIGDAHVL